jgi:uncharacterized SAM-binding protein YcdF (DUF218 family)
MVHAVVANAIARILEIPLMRSEPFARRDAIVVLGALLRSDGSPSRALEERIRAAADLYRAGGAPIVIATGGITGRMQGGDRAEADAIAEGLSREPGGEIPVRLERAAQTTADSGRLVAAMLPPRASVWLVTQPFHGRRAAYLFRRAGVDAHVWHIADSIEYRDRRRALRWLVREYAAWAAAWWRS